MLKTPSHFCIYLWNFVVVFRGAEAPEGFEGNFGAWEGASQIPSQKGNLLSNDFMGELFFFRCATELMHDIPSQTRSQSNPEEILQQDSSFSTRASVQRRTSGPCLRRAKQANGRCPQRCRKLLAWALSNQTAWPTTRSHLARTGNGGARLKPWSKGDNDPPLGDKVTAWRMGSQDL